MEFLNLLLFRRHIFLWLLLVVSGPGTSPIGFDSNSVLFWSNSASEAPTLYFTDTKFVLGGSLANYLPRIHFRRMRHRKMVLISRFCFLHLWIQLKNFRKESGTCLNSCCFVCTDLTCANCSNNCPIDKIETFGIVNMWGGFVAKPLGRIHFWKTHPKTKRPIILELQCFQGVYIDLKT